MCVLFIVAVISVVIHGAIFKKAGYSFWCGLLMLIPIVNLIWLIWFALTEWPIEQELACSMGHSVNRRAG